jgi:hypothetical protein
MKLNVSNMNFFPIAPGKHESVSTPSITSPQQPAELQAPQMVRAVLQAPHHLHDHQSTIIQAGYSLKKYAAKLVLEVVNRQVIKQTRDRS